MLSEHQLLLSATEAALQRRAYAARTVTIYVDWTRRFLTFFRHRPVTALDAAAADTFLSFLARERAVALSTQRQAASALRFFFRTMLRRPLPAARRRVASAVSVARPPYILSPAEATRLFRTLPTAYRLPVQLMYGSGLRLHEVRLLTGDAVDLQQRRIALPEREAILPHWLVRPLQAHAACVRLQRQADDRRGVAGDHNLLFPSPRLVWDEEQGAFTRVPLHASTLSKQLRRAARQAGLPAAPTCHDLRASFAAGLLAAGWEQPAVARLLGHRRARSVRRLLAAVTSLPPGKKKGALIPAA